MMNFSYTEQNKFQPKLMQENHLQIFSLKSNLISNQKSGCLNLGNQKYASQPRPKNTILSSMIQTIRKNIGHKEKTKQEYCVQHQKQNNGSEREVSKFRTAYGHQTPLIAQPPRINFIHSRSFLIRSHHQKKPIASSSDIFNTHSTQARKQQENFNFHIPLKYYNFQTAKDFIVLSKVEVSRNSLQNTQCKLCIFIPLEMISQTGYSQNLIGKMFQHLSLQKISIYLIVLQKQNYNGIEWKKYNCNVIYIDEYITNKHVFISLNALKQHNFAPNLIFLQSYNSKIQHKLYFPCFDSQFNQRQNSQHSLKYKFSFIKIRSIECLKSVELISELFVKIEILRLDQRRPKLKQKQYNLKQQINLQLAFKIKQKNKQNHHQNYVIQSQGAICSGAMKLQQKLIEYSKLIRKQVVQCQKQVKTTVQKQGRKSLPSKSPLQMISELVRNNSHIIKQVQTYCVEVQQSKMCEQPIMCDNVTYYTVQ